MSDVLVVAELLDGKARKTTLAAIGAARAVTQPQQSHYDIVVVGDGAEAAAGELAHYGARQVTFAQIDGGYICEKYDHTLASAVRDGGYGLVLATASTFGKDLMPRLAAQLGAAIAPDVASITWEGNTLVYGRPMYAGNVIGYLTLQSAIQVATVRQSEFETATRVEQPSPVGTLVPVVNPLAARFEHLGLEVTQSERPELTEADIVVAGGRALKSAENFQQVLEPLVDVLGAAMGASRAACDAGYVSNDLQVGQTGKVVAPKLYIAVGISGAIQHLAGMKGAKVIVAINKDKEAPIAQVADYFWEADLFKALPELTSALRAVKSS